MKVAILAGCLSLTLLAGCRGATGTDPTPRAPEASSTSSPAPQKRLAVKRAAPDDVPDLLDDKDIESKLAQPENANLPPEQDLAVGSRPFEGSTAVRQRLLKPLPPGTDPDTVRLVAQLLTFDPNEPDPVTFARTLRATRELVDKEAFGALDAVADTLRSKRILLQDGTWVLGRLYRFMAAGNHPARPHNLDAAEARARFERWLQQNPNSLTARHCLAQTLVDWAWEARGGGWASEVTDEDWKLFKERLQKARAVLDQAPGEQEDPFFLAQGLVVGLGLGSPDVEVREIFEQASAVDPTHAFAPYRQYALYLQPKWYGSVAQHQSFVDEVVKRTRPQMGEGLYAVLMEDPGELEVDPARQLQGFKDLLVRNPRSFYYAEQVGQKTLKTEGPEAARAFYQNIIDGKTQLPLTEGERLRLQHRLQQELGVSQNLATQPSGAGATMLGVGLGMPRKQVEKLLGPPLKVGGYGKSDLELHYREGDSGSHFYSLIVSGQTDQVISMGGAGAEALGKTLRRGMTYKDLETALGAPTEIRQLDQTKGSYLLLYQPHRLSVRWEATDQKLSLFSVKQDLQAWAGDAPPVTLAEWTRTWEP